MHWRMWAVCGCVGLVLGLTSGCQVVQEPFTGRTQYIMVSQDQEVKLGLSSWADVLKESKASTDQAKIAAVQRVGEAIKVVANRPDYQWEFRVLASTEANAFCLPGGKVAVYEGLFQFVANDAELAAVVGHEIGHAIARHGAERMSENMVVQAGAGVAAAAVSSKTPEEQQKWMTAYGGLTTVGFMLPFSRTHEYSADTIGLMLMARAGYDPHAAVDFWQKFGAGKQSGPLGDFLSTHPADSKRIESLKTLLPKAVTEYQNTPLKRGLGKKL